MEIAIDLAFWFQPYVWFGTLGLFDWSDLFVHEMSNGEAAFYFLAYWLCQPFIAVGAATWVALFWWLYAFLVLFFAEQWLFTSLFREQEPDEY